VTVRPFSAADIPGWHGVAEAARRTDDPAHPPVAEAGTRAALSAESYDGEALRWVASDDGTLAGTAEVFLPGTANLGWGFATVVVHPEHRRRGHGRALLGALAAAVTARGRGTVVLTTHPDDGGSAWATAMGAAKAQELLESQLDIGTAPIPATAAPPGYRIEQWIGACPEPLAVSFAIAKDAMADAPDGGLGYEPTKTTVEVVRAAERWRDQREVDLWVVVAVHEATGEIAGLTELELDRNCPPLAHQEDTAVIPAHRGHGIGLWLKADMLRRLASTPVRHIRTTTDPANAYMLAINERLGFRRTGVCEQWTLPVEPATGSE